MGKMFSSLPKPARVVIKVILAVIVIEGFFYILARYGESPSSSSTSSSTSLLDDSADNSSNVSSTKSPSTTETSMPSNSSTNATSTPPQNKERLKGFEDVPFGTNISKTIKLMQNSGWQVDGEILAEGETNTGYHFSRRDARYCGFPLLEGVSLYFDYKDRFVMFCVQFAVRSDEEFLNIVAPILSHYGFTQDGADELHDIPYLKDKQGTHCEIEMLWEGYMQMQFVSAEFYREVMAANEALGEYYDSLRGNR